MSNRRFRRGTVHTRGYVPHIQRKGATYSICFRLEDSIPADLRRSLLEERKMLREECAKRYRALTDEQQARIERVFAARMDRYLDAGAGACFLADPRIAQVVADALEHFNGKRYELLAWCIMPNHVHVVCRLLGNETLDRLLHSWKSFTALKANTILGRTGAFWMREYYDRVVRNRWELERTVKYVVENPVKAGLRDWRWVRVYE